MSIAQAGVLAIAIVCGVTLVAGALGLKLSRTTSDFYVAGRSVSAGWNASAIGGEYLSAASFLGIAGLVYALGADMLWFPVGYTVGYVVLLVLVAAPLRRSGAYTLPDFAEARLESRHVRALASLLVIGIGWLYLLPQFQGAGIALSTVTGAPPALGSLIVAVVVLANVTAGGMRSITLVQAMQYWLKLTAISIPAFVLLALWWQSGAAGPNVTSTGGADWAQALSGFGGREHPVYATYSTILALCFGTMGLPHVLVRFYTNPDGRAARRTTLVVVALLGLFYLFTPVYGVLGRVYLPTLPDGARADSVTLLLPSVIAPGLLGTVLSAILAGGAFAAFLSTASGRGGHRPGLPGPHHRPSRGRRRSTHPHLPPRRRGRGRRPGRRELAGGQHQPCRHGRAGLRGGGVDVLPAPGPRRLVAAPLGGRGHGGTRDRWCPRPHGDDDHRPRRARLGRRWLARGASCAARRVDRPHGVPRRRPRLVCDAGLGAGRDIATHGPDARP